MRRFDADYLSETRRGMWADSREALSVLELPTRERVLDVGCGTGEFSAVLAAATPGDVYGIDRDRRLLDRLVERDDDGRRVRPVQGDALALPVREEAFDLVVCQALLVNLPDPDRAVEGFARVSADLVAAVEPDNAAVEVDSTVEAEARLAARAREHYLRGVDTDVALGAVADRFRGAGLAEVRTTRYDHERVVEPPYSEADLEAAKRKLSGERLRATRDTLLAGGLSETAYDDLRREWREMARDVVEAMQAGEYRRREVVPFHVTVGRVADGAGEE